MVTKLHGFLEASFPSQYADRARDVEREEEEGDIASPDVVDMPKIKSRPGCPNVEDFQCDACGEMLFKPIVLNCGHVVCQVPCRGDAGDPCPLCRAPSVVQQQMYVCKHLWNLMEKSFPKECAQRRNDLAARGVDTLAHVASPRGGDGVVCGNEGGPSCRTVSCGASPAGHTEGIGAALEHDPSSSRGDDGRLERNNVETTPDYPGGIVSWLESSEYPHFGIGCDACGQYPILGRRYRCKDCPDSVGFDICGSCHERGVGSIVGRFNQRHLPDHRLEMVLPTMTKLHFLKAIHPELDYDRLLSLIEMAWEQSDGERDNDTAEQDVGVQGGQSGGRQGTATGEGEPLEQETHGQDGGESMEEDVPPMMHQRGPRPSYDPQAEWPSPAAEQNSHTRSM